MIKAVMFDLDGTVIASKDGIFRSAAYALDTLGLPMPSEADMMAFLGPPLSEGFRSVCHVDESRIDEAVRLYREYYNGGGKFQAAVFDGVTECLQALKAKGIPSYITTSKPHVFAKEILSYFRTDTAFDGIYGSEFDGTRGKKSEVVSYCMEQHGLRPEEVLLVGDRHFDVNGARQCGVRCVGVTYGYGSREELEQAGAWKLIDTPMALPDLLDAAE